MLFLVFGASLAWADAAGSVRWAGKSITYRAQGKTTSVSTSSDNNKCVVKIAVDSKRHEVRVTRAGVEYGGAKVALGAFKKVEVRAAGGKVRILVDGRQVLPGASQ
jgi:hypothetical protein